MGIFALVIHVGVAPTLPVVFGYIGPDVIVGLTSAIAAIMGVLLMFWRRFVGIVLRGWNAVFHKDG